MLVPSISDVEELDICGAQWVLVVEKEVLLMYQCWDLE